MVQEATLVSLGDLLVETGETEADNEILERVKLLAQEHLPDGWTSWKVTRLSKDEVFGERVDPQVLNKLRYALPTVQLAKAFVPETTHLSEKGFRDLKIKMLDWAFTRGLIISPPAICNKIRGSAAATELFNQAVRVERPMSRKDADRALSLETDTEPACSRRGRRRISSDPESNDAWAPKAKRSRLDSLEQQMNTMFSTLMERIDSLASERRGQTPMCPSEVSGSSNEENLHAPSRPCSPDEWRAPSLCSALERSSEQQQLDLPELEFLPDVKEADPIIPAPTEHIKAEGIACQRFGSEAWNRIRYKEVVKRLHASPVFSALRVNPELSNLGVQHSSFLSRQDGVLGTITHGLLGQRKALAEELKKLAKKFPTAAEDLRKLLSEGSDFKATSDDLLQFVCAHRAETLEMRRKAFTPKNEALSSVLHQIPPSDTHLFQEEKLSEFLKDHGGASRIFPARYGRIPNKQRPTFQQPRQTSRHSGLHRTTKSRNPVWHTRPTQAPVVSGKRGHSNNQGKKRPDKKDQRQQRRNY